MLLCFFGESSGRISLCGIRLYRNDFKHTMKKLFWLCLFAGMATHTLAQTVTVRDQENGRPLEGVTLLSGEPQAFAVTNAEGEADISAFVGAAAIRIQSLGYKAQEPSFAALEAAGFEVRLASGNLSLDEVVVSATRWRQATSNVPTKVISISPKEVALQNPQTAADLLGISGKVFIQKSQQGGGSPMIRGFATNRLIYTVDGVRMNTAIFRGGNIQNVINLDPFATQSTEVLFGPGSVIYGSDAIGGVMSFQTRVPQLSLKSEPLIKGSAVMRYATANHEKTGHLDINVGWKKWAFVTSFSSWDYDHLRQGSNGPEDYLKPYFVQRQDSMDVVITQEDPLLQVPSAYAQVNFMQKLRFKPSEDWDLQYGFHYSETTPYGRYDRHNRMRNGLPRYAEWMYGPQSWQMHNLSASHSAGSSFYDEATLRLAKQTFGESRIIRPFDSNIRSEQVEGVDAWSANLDLRKAVGARHNLYYGLEYVHNVVSSTGTATDISTGSTQADASRYPNANWRSLAAYVNDEYLLSDKVTLQGGIRYNQVHLDADFSNNAAFFPLPFTGTSIDNGALTGSMGMVYRPTDYWVLKGSLGTAFRSPNVDDAGKIFDSEPGAVTVPNPELRPEYAWNADLGVARVFGERVKLDLTAYVTRLQNALVRRDFSLNGQDSIMYEGVLSRVQAVQNAAVANVYGLQAGVEVQLPYGFSLSTDVNMQRGEEELDDAVSSPSRHAAPFFGTSRISYRQGKLDMQLYAQYQGERAFEDLPVGERTKDEIYAKDANGNNYAPAWYTLNLKARYMLTDLLSISSGIENITDQRYRPFGSGISGAGRNFILSLRAEL